MAVTSHTPSAHSNQNVPLPTLTRNVQERDSGKYSSASSSSLITKLVLDNLALEHISLHHTYSPNKDNNTAMSLPNMMHLSQVQPKHINLSPEEDPKIFF